MLISAVAPRFPVMNCAQTVDLSETSMASAVRLKLLDCSPASQVVGVPELPMVMYALRVFPSTAMVLRD